MNFKNIPQFPFASYKVNISWNYLKDWLISHDNRIMRIDMNPFYQRNYVWYKEQKVAYLEYQLRGGFSGKDIFWNCPTWDNISNSSNIVSLVDGKQRIAAVLNFLDNKIKVFGHTISKFEDKLRMIDPSFVFHINNLQTEKEIVEWYLGLNTGGSIHTNKDLKPARDFLKKEI